MAQQSVIITDGYSIDAQTATSNPSGTEGALIVRNIPSGTQDISAASLPLPTNAATETTLANRFGVTQGSPVLVNTSGQTILFAPPSGQSIRLKWLSLAAPDTNTTTVIANITLDGYSIYLYPLPSPAVFSHSSCRQGSPNGVLAINLNINGQDVYCNMDIETF